MAAQTHLVLREEDVVKVRICQKTDFCPDFKGVFWVFWDFHVFWVFGFWLGGGRRQGEN